MINAACCNAQPVDRSQGSLMLIRPHADPKPIKLRQLRQNDVVGNRMFQDKPGRFAVFGDQGQSMCDAICGVLQGNRLAVDQDLALQNRPARAKDRLQKFGPAGAQQSADTQNFPTPQPETDIIQNAAVAGHHA